MQPFPEAVAARLQQAFAAHADPDRARAMSAYMRGKFPFLGLPSPLRRSLMREALAGLRPATEDDLRGLLRLLWDLPEREFQHAAVDIVTRHLGLCGAAFIEPVECAITTKSWWDTVDGLAAHAVGPLVLRHPDLTSLLDGWAASEDLWLARTAIIHQLSFKGRTDVARLERYALLRAADRDFFIRKAIGWALREYSKTDAGWVRGFVAAHGRELSGLTRREALLWLDRRAARAPASPG